MIAHRPSGFTLVEVLVALVVTGLVLTGLSSGLSFGVLAERRQLDEAARAGGREPVSRLLAGLIERMDPGSAVGAVTLDGTDRSLHFVTTLPRSGAVGRRAEIVLTRDAARRVVLRIVPLLNGLRFAAPPPPIEAVVLDHADLRIAYLPQTVGADWTGQWNAPSPPRLVRIRLIAEDGGFWPAIIAAPQRGQP